MNCISPKRKDSWRWGAWIYYQTCICWQLCVSSTPVISRTQRWTNTNNCFPVIVGLLFSIEGDLNQLVNMRLLIIRYHSNYQSNKVTDVLGRYSPQQFLRGQLHFKFFNKTSLYELLCYVWITSPLFLITTTNTDENNTTHPSDVYSIMRTFLPIFIHQHTTTNLQEWLSLDSCPLGSDTN